MAARRRQRLARNKRKKAVKRQLQKGLANEMQQVKEKYHELRNEVKTQSALRQKYFAMWRKSENEKEKLKKSRDVFLGNVSKTQQKSRGEFLRLILH